MAEPVTKEYKVKEAGFLFSAHYKKGAVINLYPEQAVNFMPPFGDKLELVDGDGNDTKDAKEDGEKQEHSTGNSDQDVSKFSKKQLLEKLDGLNEILNEESKIQFDEGMTKAELTALIQD